MSGPEIRRMANFGSGSEARAGARRFGPVLGARAPQVLRTGRRRKEHPQGQERQGYLTDRVRGGPAHRRPVRDRAQHQRQIPRRPPRGATTPVGPAGRRSGTLAARRTGAALEARQGRQGDRLPAVVEPLAELHAVPRGRSHLPQQQCRRAVSARRGLGQKIMAIRRVRTGRAARRRHVFPDRHSQTERHRSAGLARRRHRPHLRHAGLTPARVAAVGMERSNAPGQGSLTAAHGGCLLCTRVTGLNRVKSSAQSFWRFGVSLSCARTGPHQVWQAILKIADSY